MMLSKIKSIVKNIATVLKRAGYRPRHIRNSARSTAVKTLREGILIMAKRSEEMTVLDILKDEPSCEKGTGIVSLKGSLYGDTPPKIVCSGGWEYGPHNNLMALATAGKAHSKRTGCRMRVHD